MLCILERYFMVNSPGNFRFFWYSAVLRDCYLFSDHDFDVQDDVTIENEQETLINNSTSYDTYDSSYFPNDDNIIHDNTDSRSVVSQHSSTSEKKSVSLPSRGKSTARSSKSRNSTAGGEIKHHSELEVPNTNHDNHIKNETSKKVASKGSKKSENANISKLYT